MTESCFSQAVMNSTKEARRTSENNRACYPSASRYYLQLTVSRSPIKNSYWWLQTLFAFESILLYPQC